MDCRTALLLTPYARSTGELPPDDTERLRQHLETCADCRESVRKERSFDASISQAMRNVELPEGLRERVGLSLAQLRGQAIQRRAMQVAAIALAVLLTVSVPLVRWTSRIVLLPEQMVQEEDQHFVLAVNRSSESAQEFFRSRGLRTQLPEGLDYNLLTTLDVVSFRGHRAARLDFQLGEERMKVYVLPRRDFRMSRNAAGDAQGSHATVEVVEASSDFLFVFVCFGKTNRQMFEPRAVIG